VESDQKTMRRQERSARCEERQPFVQQERVLHQSSRATNPQLERAHGGKYPDSGRGEPAQVNVQRKIEKGSLERERHAWNGQEGEVHERCSVGEDNEEG